MKTFIALLAVAFIALKITGFINWSWWWVLSPIWGGILLIILVFLFLFLLAIITPED